MSTNPRQDKDDAFDARRRLCPDGSCIGVLDASGRCKVCGTAADGSQTTPAAPEADLEDPPLADDEADALPALPDDGDGEPSAFQSGRKLCPDGSCVGVIGADGKCKVCGRAGEA
jgi:hypothetical protein